VRYDSPIVRHFHRTLVVLAALASATAAVRAQPARSTVLQRFLARGEEPPVEYRALRHLEAQNAHFGASAWMDAWTEYDRRSGFRFEIVAEGGNGYIRSRVLRAALEGEQKMWQAAEPQKASLTEDNYTFAEMAAVAEGLAALEIKPRRKDVLLVDGRIYVQADNGELQRIEGRLSKAPSFWTRRVDITRHYERLAGVRVPVSIESVAHVLIAGLSTFRMTYQYQTINGQHIGDPKPASTARGVI
jgi:hypothetical protein